MLLAIITKTICFTFADKQVTIIAGTEAEIDITEGLAKVGDYHFDIFDSEYAILN